MSNPLEPEPTVLIKLGSIATHADEFLSKDGSHLDAEAIRGLLADPEIAEWMKEMDKLAFLPIKRNPDA